MRDVGAGDMQSPAWGAAKNLVREAGSTPRQRSQTERQQGPIVTRLDERKMIGELVPIDTQARAIHTKLQDYPSGRIPSLHFFESFHLWSFGSLKA